MLKSIWDGVIVAGIFLFGFPVIMAYAIEEHVRIYIKTKGTMIIKN